MTDLTGDTDEWIRASEAYRRISLAGAGPVGAANTIAAYLRDGLLPATAAQIWKSDERFISKAWKEKPVGSGTGAIPRRHWRYDKCITTDIAEGRLQFSRLSMTCRLKPRRRIMMRSVKFSLDALKHLEPDIFGPHAKERRGRPPSTAARDAGWLVVVELALAAELHKGSYTSQNELALHMQELLTGRVPASKGKPILGEGQINEIAQMVYPTIPSSSTSPAIS